MRSDPRPAPLDGMDILWVSCYLGVYCNALVEGTSTVIDPEIKAILDKGWPADENFKTFMAMASLVGVEPFLYRLFPHYPVRAGYYLYGYSSVVWDSLDKNILEFTEVADIEAFILMAKQRYGMQGVFLEESQWAVMLQRQRETHRAQFSRAALGARPPLGAPSPLSQLHGALRR
jgi:hypothetical protein